MRFKIRIAKDIDSFGHSMFPELLTIRRGKFPKRIPDEIRDIQFAHPLTERELRRLGEIFSKRPNLTLRVYGNANPDLNFLRLFPNLREFGMNLYRCESLEPIAKHCSLLTSLSMSSPFGKHSLKAIGDLNLEQLFLENPWDHMETISQFRNLRRLLLRSVKLKSLDLLEPLDKLEWFALKLGGTHDLSALALLPNLRYLEIWMVRKLCDLSVLKDLKSLRVLFLQALKGVKQLPSLADLQSLRVIYLETMKGLEDLSGIRDAPRLELMECIDCPQLTFDHFKIFKGHPSLREMHAAIRMKDRSRLKEYMALPGLERNELPDWTVNWYPGRA